MQRSGVLILIRAQETSHGYVRTIPRHAFQRFDLPYFTPIGVTLFGVIVKAFEKHSSNFPADMERRLLNLLGAFHISKDQLDRSLRWGDQDVKVIRLSTAGALLDFKMNDKCSVGAVRFFEAHDSLLDTPEVEFDALAGS